MDLVLSAMLEFRRGPDMFSEPDTSQRKRHHARIAVRSAADRRRGAAPAQSDYPSRPVRIIVPSEPGGGTDISARILAEKLSQAMGQQFVVENRPGAGQMIGTEQVARSPNDGYTLLVAAAAITILPATNPT